ncbi:MAG: hypothetical protein IPK15_16270 [Verrucomicrobia bacterium]|nr:hypothetical protein [Verrucomicrobiota bacterium]
MGYSPEIYAAYGRILAEMHDSKEAGKFLFLSGLATQEEESLTGLFIDSVRGRPWQQVLSCFPRTALKDALTDYPERVRVELKALGYPDEIGKQSLGQPPTWRSRLGQAFAALVGLCFLALLIVGLVHGFYVVGRWLFVD